MAVDHEDGHPARGLREPLAVYRGGLAGSLSSNKLSLVEHNWLYRKHERPPAPWSTLALSGAVWHRPRSPRTTRPVVAPGIGGPAELS
ncbi:hypothetical protein STENM327S_07825 [Streptomyces tendae]